MAPWFSSPWILSSLGPWYLMSCWLGNTTLTFPSVLCLYKKCLLRISFILCSCSWQLPSLSRALSALIGASPSLLLCLPLFCFFPLFSYFFVFSICYQKAVMPQVSAQGIFDKTVKQMNEICERCPRGGRLLLYFRANPRGLLQQGCMCPNRKDHVKAREKMWREDKDYTVKTKRDRKS